MIKAGREYDSIFKSTGTGLGLLTLTSDVPLRNHSFDKYYFIKLYILMSLFANRFTIIQHGLQ